MRHKVIGYRCIMNEKAVDESRSGAPAERLVVVDEALLRDDISRIGDPEDFDLFLGLFESNVRGFVLPEEESEEPPRRIFSTKYCLEQLEAPDDRELFEQMRAARRELAEKQGIPQYVVFSNRTLLEMCLHRPRSAEELRDLYGVGAVNSAKYGEMFLALIRERDADDGLSA